MNRAPPGNNPKFTTEPVVHGTKRTAPAKLRTKDTVTVTKESVVLDGITESRN
jgi:hypothetical protein